MGFSAGMGEQHYLISRHEHCERRGLGYLGEGNITLNFMVNMIVSRE